MTGKKTDLIERYSNTRFNEGNKIPLIVSETRKKERKGRKDPDENLREGTHGQFEPMSCTIDEFRLKQHQSYNRITETQ